MTKQTSDYHGSKMMKTNQTTSFVVAAVLIQALSLPVMAEEIHGILDNNHNLSLRPNVAAYPLGGELNVSIGYQSLGNGNSGSFNTATGGTALSNNTTGENNVAYGSRALRMNKTGSRNTAVGQNALFNNTSGSDNVAIGTGALMNTNKGSSTAIGTDALFAGVQVDFCGTGSTAIGYRAGYLNTGCGNVFIGVGAGAADLNDEAGYATKNNQLAIANSTSPDSEIITGDFAEKTIGLNGSVTVKNRMVVRGEMKAFESLRVNKNIYTGGHLKVKKTATAQSFNTTSDARLKQDIQPLNDALSSVLQLQGKTYRWKEDHHKQDIGLIAQEVEQVFPELVDEDANGFKAIAYSRLTAVLIEAIKEQQGQMISQQQQMTAQQDQIAALEKENTLLKIIMAEQVQALLARVAMLEGVALAAN